MLDAIQHQPDRSAAIVATAVLESMLQRVVLERLTYKAPTLTTQLFDNRGPLSDFHSKILIATAFGIITPNMADELHRIKAIRNVFAHAAIDITFDTKEVAAEVAGFRMLKAMQEVTMAEDKMLYFPSRSAFLLVVRILCIMLSSDHKQHSGEELLA
jgi:DNA-binding MltR family transcriptional regulator